MLLLFSPLHCEYLEELKSDSHVSFSLTYLERVYPENPTTERMFQQGIPVQLGFNYVMHILEGIRDGYCMLTTGMKHKELEKPQGLMEQRKDENDD